MGGALLAGGHHSAAHAGLAVHAGHSQRFMPRGVGPPAPIQQAWLAKAAPHPAAAMLLTRHAVVHHLGAHRRKQLLLPRPGPKHAVKGGHKGLLPRPARVGQHHRPLLRHRHAGARGGAARRLFPRAQRAHPHVHADGVGSGGGGTGAAAAAGVVVQGQRRQGGLQPVAAVGEAGAGAGAWRARLAVDATGGACCQARP